MDISRRSIAAIVLLLPFVGIISAMWFVVPAVEEAFLYKVIAFDSESAEAQVVGVEGGELIVRFTPEGGNSTVETVASGSFDAADPPESVEVSYVEDLPSYARLNGSFWLPRILYGIPILFLATFLVMFHPSGPRAEICRARREGHEKSVGKEKILRSWKPLLGFSVLGLGLGLMVVPALRFTAHDIIENGALVPWFPAGFALLFWGGALAVVTAADLVHLRKFRDAPVKQPWFFPKETLGIAVLAFVLLIGVMLGVSFLRGEPELENPQAGEGVIVDLECRSRNSGGCLEHAQVEYIVQGLMYREYVRRDHEGVDVGDQISLEWSAADPSQVRESNS